MNKYTALSLAVLLFASCCPGKRMTSDGSTTDSVRHEHREVRADTLSRITTAEQHVQNLAEAEIVTETVVYDTGRADSTGQAPVLERRRTTARLRSNTTGTHLQTLAEDSVAVMELTVTADSVSSEAQAHHEQRESSTPWLWILPVSVVVGVVFAILALVLVVMLRRWTS